MTALGGEIVVVVDVLRFTTAVEAGVAAGLSVYPYRWETGTAEEFAASVGARLADGRDPAGASLSPASLMGLEAGSAVVLPSPNGSSCAVRASEAGATVVAGCLRNASSVARWVSAQGGAVAVIAAGERWPDGTLRPAVEDLIGAGAVLAHLSGSISPEARMAIAAFEATSDQLPAVLAESASGRELNGKGWADDLSYAGAVGASRIVPVMAEGAFRPGA